VSYQGESHIPCKRCGTPNADVELLLCSACVCSNDEEDQLMNESDFEDDE
jgi:NMD protein affecting ribosome stability and mRNA decay